jgi:hypothetical protein
MVFLWQAGLLKTRQGAEGPWSALPVRSLVCMYLLVCKCVPLAQTWTVRVATQAGAVRA